MKVEISNDLLMRFFINTAHRLYTARLYISRRNATI